MEMHFRKYPRSFEGNTLGMGNLFISRNFDHDTNENYKVFDRNVFFYQKLCQMSFLHFIRVIEISLASSYFSVTKYYD